MSLLSYVYKPGNEAIQNHKLNVNFCSLRNFMSNTSVPPAILTSENMLIIATHISAPFPLTSFGHFLWREFKCSSISAAVFITCWWFYLVKKFSWKHVIISCTTGLPTLISWKDAANGSVSDRVLLSSWDSKQAITTCYGCPLTFCNDLCCSASLVPSPVWAMQYE